MRKQFKILKSVNKEFFSLSILKVNSSFVTSEVFGNFFFRFIDYYSCKKQVLHGNPLGLQGHAAVWQFCANLEGAALSSVIPHAAQLWSEERTLLLSAAACS